MKHLGLLLIAFWLAFCGSGSASVTEIRQNFFNQRTNLPATAIMLAPTGDASYLISVYESTVSCEVVPTLRWTDENGVARSQQGIIGPASLGVDG
jgi:GTP cyclohydrolase FolE2